MRFFDSPLYHALCSIFDLVIANLLFILCSLPVVTMGASYGALCYVCQRISRGEGSIWRDFFSAFRQSFCRFSICFWLLVLCFAVIVADFWIIGVYWTSAFRYVPLGLLLLAGLLLLITGSYLFPMLADSMQPPRKLLSAAFVQSMCHLPRTVLICLLKLLPLALFLFLTSTFFLTCVVWIVIGFSLTEYVTALLTKPILSNLP